MTHIVKNTTRTAITLVLVFSILFESLYFKPEKVEASTPDVTAFLNYMLSQSGAIASNGQSIASAISKFSDSYKENLANSIGSGIYVDSDGNYVFSASVTQDFYNALNSNSNIDCRVVSSFKKFGTYATNINYSPTVQAWISNQIGASGYSQYMLTYGYENNGKSKCIIWDISNLGYIVVSGSHQLQFYNTSGGQAYLPYKYIQWYSSSGNTDGYSSGSSDRQTNWTYSYSGNNNILGNTPIADYSSVDAFYNNVPSGDCIFSNKSLIFAKSSSAGNSYINSNNRVFVSNTYNTFPKVNKTVIENNDWSKIYNNYVQNVKNNKNYYTTNNTIDTSKLQQIVSQYGDQITEAIESGNTDIAEQLNFTNNWLSRIYVLLDQIYQKLDSDDDSGGTVSGSTVDLSNIESYLQSLNTSISAMKTQIDFIADNLPNNEQQLTQIYTILQNIYQSLQNIPSGGSPNDPNSDPYAPWYPKFFGIPDTDIIDTVEKIEIIEALLSGLVPLCYITGIGAVVNALSAEPVEPVFTIPVQFDNSFYSVDEELEIDLTAFDDMRDVVTGGIILVFMLSLGYFTIILLKFLLDIMSKS